MNDLLEFLTSKEIIIVYIISALTCFICIVVYLIEKNNDNIRKKHNTKELNKLVEEVRAQLPEEEEEPVIYDVPILETIDVKEESSINDLIANEPVIIETVENNEPIEVEKQDVEVEPLDEEDEFEYTTIEPDQATAKLELRQLEEELERQEALERENNIRLTSFEEEQERTAIISMEELLAKSKELYEANEATQYKDDGNEPISIQDLEKQTEKESSHYEEPFIIENVVPKEELINVEEVSEKMHMDDFFTIQEPVEEIHEAVINPLPDITPITPTIMQPEVGALKPEVVAPQPVAVEVKPKEEVKKFKSSPIISPIFGIEKDVSSENEMALENTANYEKLDAEIRKTNEFVMSLKELQRKLD